MYVNEVSLVGTIDTVEETYYSYAEWFSKVFINVQRTSGIYDTIPVVISHSFFNANKAIGEKVKLLGEIRRAQSYYVFAKAAMLVSESISDQNNVELIGKITRLSTIRETPLTNRTIMDFTVSCYDRKGASCRIPCIAWERKAWYVQNYLDVGDVIEVSGRLQSRLYLKRYENGNEEQKVTYEVSINRIQLI